MIDYVNVKPVQLGKVNNRPSLKDVIILLTFGASMFSVFLYNIPVIWKFTQIMKIVIDSLSNGRTMGFVVRQWGRAIN